MKLSKKRKEVLTGLSFVIGLACFAETRQYCAFHMPESANLETGRSIPFEASYGKTVYLTASERNNVYLVYAAATAAFAVTVTLVFSDSWQAFKDGITGKA